MSCRSKAKKFKNKLVHRRCDECGTPIARKPNEVKSYKFLFCSKQCKSKFVGKLLSVRAHSSDYQIPCGCGCGKLTSNKTKNRKPRRFIHGHYRNRMNRFSKPHRLFVALFKNKFGIDLDIEFPLITECGEVRFYDCRVPGRSILFEIDGIYWHSKKAQIQRDIEKDELAKNLGYTLFRIPENKVIEFISTFLLENSDEHHCSRNKEQGRSSVSEEGLGEGCSSGQGETP